MSTLKSQSIRGFLWDLLGKISIQGVGFVVSVILTRILFPEDFGLIAIATVFMNFANLIMDFGFSRALIQRKEVTENHYSTVFFLNLTIGIVLFLIVFLLAPLIGNVYDSEVLPLLIRVLSINFIVSSFGNVVRAKLYREMDFKIISFVNIVSSIVSGVLAVSLAFLDYGVWSLVWQSIALIILSNTLINVYKPSKIKPKFYKNEAKELWGFSSNLFASGVIDSVFLNLDQLVIGKALSPATLGFYYRSKNLENFAFSYTAGTLASVLFPSLSKIHDDKEKLKSVFIRLFHVLAIFSFFICGLLFTSAEDIIVLLFTEKWLPMVSVFQILIVGAFSKQIFSLLYNTLLSAGMAKDYLKINTLNKILLLLSLPLIVYVDLQSYLLVFICIQFFNLFVGIFYVQKIINVGSMFIKNLFIYLTLYAVTLALISWIKFEKYEMLFNLSFNSLIYAAAFFTIYFVFARDGMNILKKELNNLKIK